MGARGDYHGGSGGTTTPPFFDTTYKTPFEGRRNVPAEVRAPRAAHPPPRRGSRRKCWPAGSMRRPRGGRKRPVSDAMWCDGGGDSQRISAPIECRAGRTPMGLNHAFLFAVWGGLGEWGGDVGEAVSLRPGETCGEPSARVFGDGSSQPVAARLRAEILWLPNELQDHYGGGAPPRFRCRHPAPA